MSDLVIYDLGDGRPMVRVRFEGETVWLTQRQMSELLATSTDNVGLHLKNIYAESELDEKATTENFSVVQTEGAREINRIVTHYNLDAIISVGYRVNSRRAVRFRQWATGVLREHLVQGYTLNHARLAERGLSEAQQAIDLLARTLNSRSLVTAEGSEVLALIAGYARTWHLLLKYDENNLHLPDGCQPAQGALDSGTARAAITKLKSALSAWAEASDLFGRERGDAFEAILGNIEQSMFGEPLYKTREEKAAHLPYFVIKDHPFTDGNKRIGSFMFLLYLQQEAMAMNIDETALTALALLIAESQPASKDLMIRLIVNLLVISAPNS